MGVPQQRQFPQQTTRPSLSSPPSSSSASSSPLNNKVDLDNVDSGGDDDPRGISSKRKMKSSSTQGQTGKTWGRSRDVDNLTVVVSACILLFCPILVFYFYIACHEFQGSLIAPLVYLVSSTTKPPTWLIPSSAIYNQIGNVMSLDVMSKLSVILPQFDFFSVKLYLGWVAFQAILYAILPSQIGYGQETPAGHILPYKVNGLLAWTTTHIAFYLICHWLQIVPASIIARHWGGLLIASNLYGYALTAFCFLKAHLFPSHPNDRKFSGSFIYDLFMGIEFNPRFGKLWDFKLFHNGRPGIIAWTLINWSFAARQYEVHGSVSNSMLLLNFFHLLYVLDFFYNEDWYLRTIDIAHDHFGFYLSWGDSVWLPFMYTLQSHYLLQNPTQLGTVYFCITLGIGLVGYYIFRSVNYQKDIVRLTNGNCLIWGKKPTVIRTKYVTSDGKEHESILLASGFWGLSRHFNYLGDLLLSLAMCLTCDLPYPISSGGHLLPYFYIIYMCILLGNRVVRDDARCRGKYGKYWEEYCRIVKYKVIPGVL